MSERGKTLAAAKRIKEYLTTACHINFHSKKNKKKRRN